ncbi:MAG: hypothetical protein LBP93_05790 [Treponema sp.]|jgi:hypothetical protein|nr:hypothetical protein [Treponema sp.]
MSKLAFRKKALWCIVCLSLILSGCNAAKEAVAELREISISAPDALTCILEEIKNKKIIFIGESHPIVNEELFIAENIGDFYDAGVRYIFDESGIPDYLAIGDENYFFFMFYPWMSAGWRYEGASYYQAVRNLNASLPEEDRIKIIAPESGREDYSAIEQDDWMNYRDSYAAKAIIAIMDSAVPNEKALIHYGSVHGIKRIQKNKGNNYKPLGSWLLDHYGNSFASYRFYLPYEVRNSDILIQEWRGTITVPKIIVSEDIHHWDIFYDKDNYDGFIVEPETKFGSFYQYVPVNANLRYIFNLVKDLRKTRDFYGNDSSAFLSGEGQYIMALYYLKMYYGEHFNYNFWRTSESTGNISLQKALDDLETYAFTQNQDASDYINLHHSENEIRLYMEYMFYTNIEEFLSTKKPYQIIEYCRKALDIFPEDLWPLYWIALVLSENKEYTSALDNFQKLFENKLSLNMEVLPLAYKKASFCALQSGNDELANQYKSMSTALYNEYGIDVSNYYELGYLFDK